MIFCFDLPLVVDRVEDEVAVVEIAGATVDLPGLADVHEGDRLRLCATRDGGEAATAPPVPGRPAPPSASQTPASPALTSPALASTAPAPTAPPSAKPR